jgi:tRNA (guanine-N7-)-methyltransferase
VMAPGAELRIATDDADYQTWVTAQLAGDPRFAKLAEYAGRPSDWRQTRYEAKALAAGRRPLYWIYRRSPSLL